MSDQTKITRDDALGRAVSAAHHAGNGCRADESIAYSQLAQAWALIVAVMPMDAVATVTHDTEAR